MARGLRHRIREVAMRPFRRWLRDEAELSVRWYGVAGFELRLGFAEVNAEGLSRDALQSSPVLLRRATVRGTRLAFSCFGSPALVLEVEGLQLEVSSRPFDDLYWNETKIDTEEQARRKRLAAIDPEGSAEHARAEKRVHRGHFEFFIRLLTAFCLSAIRIEVRDVQVTYICKQQDRSACLSAAHMLFPQGPRNSISILKGSMLGSALGSFGCAIRKAPLEKSSSVSELSLRFETSCPTKKALAPGEHAVLVMMLFVSFNFSQAVFSDVALNVPEAVMGLDSSEADTLMVVISELQGPHGDSEHVRVQQHSPLGRSAKELWTWAIEEALKRSPLQTLSRTLEAGVNRRRYVALYQQWLQEIGWRENQNKVARPDRLKKLSAAISELERQLPVEAVALARLVSRRRRVEALSSDSIEASKRHRYSVQEVLRKLRSSPLLAGGRGDSKGETEVVPKGARQWADKFSLNFSRASAVFLAHNNSGGAGISVRWRNASISYGAADSLLGFSFVLGSMAAELLSPAVEQKRSRKRRECTGCWDEKAADRFTFFSGSSLRHRKKGIMQKYSNEVEKTHNAVTDQERLSWLRKPWKMMDAEQTSFESPFLLVVYQEASLESVDELSCISNSVVDAGRAEFIFSCSMLRQALPLITEVDRFLASGTSSTNGAPAKPSSIQELYKQQISQYLDTLRDSLCSIIPNKHFQCSATIQSVQVHFLNSDLPDGSTGRFIYDLGHLDFILCPPEEEATEASGADGSSAETKTWTRKLPSPSLPSLEGCLEPSQVGLNFVAYIDGVAIRWRRGEASDVHIVEPFGITVESSFRRDHFSSLFDSFKIVSMSVTVAVASTVVDFRLDSLIPLLQCLSSIKNELSLLFSKDLNGAESCRKQNETEDSTRRIFALWLNITLKECKAYLGNREGENAAGSQFTLGRSWLHCTLGDGLCSSICLGLETAELQLVVDDAAVRHRSRTIDKASADHLIMTFYDTSMGTDNSQHQMDCVNLAEFGKARDELFCSVEVDLGNVIMSECSVENLIAKARASPSTVENMRVLLAVEKNTQKCVFEAEGGLFLLHTTVLLRLRNFWQNYVEQSQKCFFKGEPKNKVHQDHRVAVVERSYSLPEGAQSSKNLVPFRSRSNPEDIWENMDVFLVEGVLSLKISSLSLIAATTVISERTLEGILIELNGTSVMEMHRSSCKIIADINPLSVISLQFQAHQFSRSKPQRIPEFGMKMAEDRTPENYNLNQPSSGTNEGSRLDHILEGLRFSCSLSRRPVLNQKWKRCWQGAISVSGLHVTPTTYEVQMLASIATPLLGMSSTESTPKQATEKHPRSEPERQSIPDGATVAIKDAQEHLYLAVEETEGQYHLTGAWHYSVAGERALFQVKYQEGSKDKTPWFSLHSLYAKSSTGAPYRVHYRPGSRQVEISSTNDGSWELWQCTPYRSGTVSEFDVYSGVFGNLVHLVNQKSKQGIACVDGIPTFTRHPGNAFKVQVISQADSSRAHGATTDVLSEKDPSKVKLTSTISTAVVPHIDLDIGSVSVTLLHEAAGALHLLPLIRFRMEQMRGLVQVTCRKMRIVAGCDLVLEHFEAQSSSWLSIVNPVVTNFVWSSRSGRSDMHGKVPSSMFCKLKKVDVVVNELSLDACLFLIGVMDLAGPFTVHHSPVLVNRCQIENQTGLSLLCHFDRGTGGQEEGKVPSWQLKSYLMRHVTSRRGTTPAEVSTSVSINLEKPGKGFSSPVMVSLGQPGVLAVRTRLEAFQDSKQNAPGPIVVVDVSRQSQDGIYLTVSPMVKIHNATGLALQLRCRRPKQADEKGAIVSLKDGDIIDDAMGSFDALSLEGEIKKALLSFNVGNFLLSIRPESFEGQQDVTYEWSEDVKGAKAVRVSGLFEKLNYSFKRTLKSKRLDFSFGSVFCKASGVDVPNGLHFLIRTSRRQVAVTKMSNEEQHKRSLVAWQEQQELLLLPTLRVSNYLSLAVQVRVATSPDGLNSITPGANEVTIPEKGGRASLYVDLSVLFLLLKDADSALVSDPVDISTGHKRYQELAKKGGNIKDLDIEINFKGGMHAALLKVYRADDGVLELSIFTKYALRNDSEVLITCCATRSSSKWRGRRSRNLQWPSSASTVTLHPNSFTSWFYKTNDLLLKRDEEGAQPAALDLDALSGSAEISLGKEISSSIDRIQLGMSLQVPYEADTAPSHILRIAPRYTVTNDSAKQICVSQDGFEDDEQKHVVVEPGGKVAVHAQVLEGEKEGNDKSISEGMEKQHTSALSLRFRLQENGWRWSGRVNAASLGSFFLKLRTSDNHSKKQFAILSVEEDAATLAIKFRLRKSEALPYRVENRLQSSSVSFHQLGMTESEVLSPKSSTDYVWDDLSLQHRLAITLAGSGTQACSEVNLDKVKAWKSFAAAHRKKGFSLQLPFQTQLGYSEREQPDELLEKGYEVYADGPTRVLRICEKADSTKKSYWQSELSPLRQKLEFKVPIFRIFMIETGKQKIEDLTGEDLTGNATAFTPFLCAVMTSISTEFMVTVEYTFCQFKVQDLGIDIKWQGAPFAAMLRVHDQDRLNKSTTAAHGAVVLSNSARNPIQVKYSSLLLQAFDLNIDEDTLLKLVPFYRTSLSTASSSRQIYFERFEIHPIKIVGSFLPGHPRADYTSAQETFRALLHTVIKLPSVRGASVELNGVLLSHALLTFRELMMKCIQHYSWYAMRAIYIARGSKLLPPGFASLFDDSAASSLDVFFDPSSGSIDLQGLTLGMFNLLSRGLRKKGQGGTSRYLGDLEKTVKKAGSNLAFAVVTELSDNVLKGAEANGFDGMINGFRRGILNVAMQPLVLQKAVVRGGSTRRIQLDRSVGTDEAYVEGYLQATLDAVFKQEYLKVKVMEDQVVLKNLPPNSMLMNDIISCVKGFLVGEGLLAGEVSSAAGRSLRLLRGEQERKIVPAAISLGEQLFVIFAIRGLRRYTKNVIHVPGWLGRFSKSEAAPEKETSAADGRAAEGTGVSEQGVAERPNLKRAVGNFFISSAVAYIDGRLCRHIPNELARRIVSGFLLSFVE